MLYLAFASSGPLESMFLFVLFMLLFLGFGGRSKIYAFKIDFI